MRKSKNHPIDKENEWLEYRMQMLLPSEWFQQAVKLQPIEKNKKKNLPSTKAPNPVG